MNKASGQDSLSPGGRGSGRGGFTEDGATEQQLRRVI